jgi:hypothetical protein
VTKYPAPTREYHHQFCMNEGWSVALDAKGKPVGHHPTFELVLHDGSVLRTYISKPINNTDYGPQMWSKIRREQLMVSEEEFWNCAQNGVLPDRGAPAAVAEGTPLYLIRLLIEQIGLTEEEATALTLEEAQARVAEFWSRPR